MSSVLTTDLAHPVFVGDVVENAFLISGEIEGTAFALCHDLFVTAGHVVKTIAASSGVGGIGIAAPSGTPQRVAVVRDSEELEATSVFFESSICPKRVRSGLSRWLGLIGGSMRWNPWLPLDIPTESTGRQNRLRSWRGLSLATSWRCCHSFAQWAQHSNDFQFTNSPLGHHEGCLARPCFRWFTANRAWTQ